MSNALSYMSVAEFQKSGLLREVNRCFFHPRGLALAIVERQNGDVEFLHRLLKTDDLESFYFGDSELGKPEALQGALYSSQLLREREEARTRSLGAAVEPLPVRKGQDALLPPIGGIKDTGQHLFEYGPGMVSNVPPLDLPDGSTSVLAWAELSVVAEDNTSATAVVASTPRDEFNQLMATWNDAVTEASLKRDPNETFSGFDCVRGYPIEWRTMQASDVAWIGDEVYGFTVWSITPKVQLIRVTAKFMQQSPSGDYCFTNVTKEYADGVETSDFWKLAGNATIRDLQVKA